MLSAFVSCSLRKFGKEHYYPVHEVMLATVAALADVVWINILTDTVVLSYLQN